MSMAAMQMMMMGKAPPPAHAATPISISTEDVYRAVVSLGADYNRYGDLLRERGIVGQVFVTLTDEELRGDFQVRCLLG